jgi:membrane protein DedA with SNARE-associated domain
MAGQSTAYLVSRGLLRERSVPMPVAPLLAVVFVSRPVPVLAEAVVLSAGVARMNWSKFILACGSGNLIFGGVLALNGSQWVSGSLIAPGLLLPIFLPMAARLTWRRMRRVDDRGG